MDAALDARLAVLAKDLDIEATNPEIYEKVRELILDGSSFKTITIEEGGKLEKFTNLTKLSLNGTGLTSLTNFPELPNLKILELTDNYISDPVIFTIIPKLFPNLKVLHMGGNHLKNPKDVKSLVSYGMNENEESEGCHPKNEAPRPFRLGIPLTFLEGANVRETHQ